jgi:hypothetical protein
MYNEGYTQAILDLGLEKTAGIPPAVLRTLSKAIPTLKNIGRDLGEMTWGKPKQFYKELREGTALDKGSLIRESFKTPALWQKALFYGFPAVSAVQTLRGDEPYKAERLGGLLGGTILGTAAVGPLGMLGSVPLGFLGDRIGTQLTSGLRRMSGGA